jgi:hypothetical protein
LSSLFLPDATKQKTEKRIVLVKEIEATDAKGLERFPVKAHFSSAFFQFLAFWIILTETRIDISRAFFAGKWCESHCCNGIERDRTDKSFPPRSPCPLTGHEQSLQ